MKKRFSEAQIIGFLREADAGVAVKELCRRHGFSDANYYIWRRKFGGLEVSDTKRLKVPEQENARPKKLLTEGVLEQAVTPRGATKKLVGAPARREVVRWMCGRGLTERHALRVMG